METDWHCRGRTLRDARDSSSLPTLPSLAELFPTSSPTTAAVSAHDRQPTASWPPVVPSTAPSVAALHAPVAPLAASARHSHSSLHELAEPAAAPAPAPERPSHPEPYSSDTAEISAAPWTSDVCQSLHGQRQDSASAHHHVEFPTESLPAAHPGVQQQSPNGGHFTNSAVPASGHSPQLSQDPTSVSSSLRSFEQVANSSSPHDHTSPDLSSRRISASMPSDHAITGITRQQRYNVRFAAHHTPSNMPPSAQRNRHSPPLPTPASVRGRPISPTPSPPRHNHVAPTVEPAIQAITRSLQHSEGSLHSEEREREPSVERCLKCHAIWDRPLPNLADWDQDSPAESANGFARASMNIVARMQQHGKEADRQYELWKLKHSNCPDPVSPVEGGVAEHAASQDPRSGRHLHDSSRVHAPIKKRKSEILHGDTAKARKTTFDTHPSAAPSVRPAPI